MELQSDTLVRAVVHVAFVLVVVAGNGHLKDFQFQMEGNVEVVFRPFHDLHFLTKVGVQEILYFLLLLFSELLGP